MNTFIENSKLSLVGLPAPIAASFNSAGVSVAGSRSIALVLALGAFTFTGVNKLTLSLEDSADNVTFAPVVNGANSGAETNVLIGRTNGSDIYHDANGLPLSSVVIDGTTDANGAGDSVGSDVYVLEYLGTAKYVRLVGVVAGTVSVTSATMAGTNSLNVLPNIADIG